MTNIDRDLGFDTKALSAFSMRAKASLTNLAMQNMPGYKRQVVQFEELMRQACANGTDPAAVEPKLERDTSGGATQNNVSLLDELTTLDKLRTLNDLLTRRVGSYFTTMNKAIMGR